MEFRARLDYDPNPERLTYDQALEMVKFCPICGRPWEKGTHRCSRECGVVLRVTEDSFNWWHFYPRHNRGKVLKR